MPMAMKAASIAADTLHAEVYNDPSHTHYRSEEHTSELQSH